MSATTMSREDWCLLLVTFLIPVSAITPGVLVLGEVLTGNALTGMLVIFLGLVLVDGRLFVRRR